MAQAVPLAGALRVELDFVVVAVRGEGRVDKGGDFVNEAFAVETGGLDGADGPIEGDGEAVFELRVGGFEDFGGDVVQGAVDVLFAVLVEDAPGAACGLLAGMALAGGFGRSVLTLRHILDLGEVIEVGDLRHVDD